MSWTFPSFSAFFLVIFGRYRSPGLFDLRPWCLSSLFGWTRPSAPRGCFLPRGADRSRGSRYRSFRFCSRRDWSILRAIAGPLYSSYLLLVCQSIACRSFVWFSCYHAFSWRCAGTHRGPTLDLDSHWFLGLGVLSNSVYCYPAFRWRYAGIHHFISSFVDLARQLYH